MNQASSPSSAIHSATVEMSLKIGEQQLAVAQMGPDFVILAEPPEDHVPTPARLSLTIDGLVDEWPIRLPKGIQVGIQEVMISTL